MLRGLLSALITVGVLLVMIATLSLAPALGVWVAWDYSVVPVFAQRRMSFSQAYVLCLAIAVLLVMGRFALTWRIMPEESEAASWDLEEEEEEA